MKAYKIFNNDWTCNGFQYEVGKTYEFDGNIKLCESGFHACKNLHDCFKYYDCVPWNKIAEVELLGAVLGENGDKQVTNKIKIIKEIPFEKIGKIIKTAMENGISRSNGISWSNGISNSYGILNANGINKGLFVANIKNDCLIFNTAVSTERFDTIMFTFTEYLNGWKPTTNNLKSLYIKSGSEWKQTPITNATSIQKQETWKDMPEKAVKYLKSLPEFNQEIFEEITGINP